MIPANGPLRDRVSLPVVVAGAAVLLTALVYGIPPVLFGYPLPGASIFVSTLCSVSALAVCVLFAMRHRRSHTRTDLLVACTFGVVALVEATLPLIGELVPDAANVAFWSRVIARTLVALALCATAWMPERPISRRAFTAIAAFSAAAAAVVVTWTTAWASVLPASVTDADDTGSALLRTPAILSIRLAGSVLLLAAAIGFVRKARIRPDPVLSWLAGGAVLMATARFHDFLFPSLHNDWVTTGDMLRVVAQWVILAGLLIEIATLWRSRASDARDEERRHLAAELHDGLAQELAYLNTHSVLLERDPANREHMTNLRAAAERALAEARLAITQYTNAGQVALDQAIVSVATQVEDRYGCRVRLDLAEIRVSAHTAHELCRVAREALVNAARHAHPDVIDVRLDTHAGCVRLRVADNGSGIDRVAAVDQVAGVASYATPRRDARFGLTTMRERAERLGGKCSIISAPLDGTMIAVEVPQR